MPLNQEIENARTIASHLIEDNILDLAKAGSGANSNVFRLDTNQRRLALKLFPTQKNDQRKRVKTEWEALSFMRRCGMVCVPEPIACDESLNAIIFEWIDGSIITEHTEADLDGALSFISNVFRISDREDALHFAAASEACLSGVEILRQIKVRLTGFAALEPVHTFIQETFLPVLEASCALNKNNPDHGKELGKSFRRLIPADFGFHNTLKSTANELRFVDFDYFGWDDPVKMTVDFMIHPAHALNEKEKLLVQQRLADALPNDPGFSERLKLHAPLYALRWALILLNPFRTDRIQANEVGTDKFNSLLQQQLLKAKRFCQYAEDFIE